MLERVYSIIQQETKDKKFYLTNPIRPTKDFTINDFNIPENRQKSKVKEYLSKTLAFIEMKKHFRFADGYTVIPIPCNGKRLLSMFNNSTSSVSRFIDYMITIGLIGNYDESYQFNAYYDKSNKCKLYVYSYDTENKIKEYCKENKINIYKIRNKREINYNNNNSSQLQSFEKSSVRFSSKLQLLKPDNWTCSQFEDYLTGCLYENYPKLEHYQELADYINDTYYADNVDLQISFVPTFTWSSGNKAVRKIGIRATNHLVNAKKEKEDDDRENQLYKEQVKEALGLHYEFDVKSSVPRITYFLNHGEWLDNSIDLYEMMFNNFIRKCPSEKTEWNQKTREIFKSFHMRGYFDTYGKLAAHIKREIATKIDYNKNEWTELDYLMKAYKESIEETIGNLDYDSEVFFHESCIYMDVLLDLLKKGYKVWQCYDCWYTDKEVEDIQEIVKDKVNNYKDTIIVKENKINYNNNNSSQLQNEELMDLVLMALDS